MRIAIERKIEKGVREASRKLGIREGELVDRAVILYLESLRSVSELLREFQAWDELSDESFLKFEKKLGSRL